MKEEDRMGQNLWMGLVFPENKNSIYYAIKCIDLCPFIYYLEILGALNFDFLLYLFNVWYVCEYKQYK